MSNRLSLRIALLLIGVLILGGACGYMLTENNSFPYALYVAITTFTTLGTERPTTPWGMAFTALYVLIGVGVSYYVISSLVYFVAEGHFSRTIERRRMERSISQLRDHFIICGCGRVGRQITTEFAREGVSYVLVDSNPDSLTDLAMAGHLVIAGSPASDEILRKARLETARGLIAATDSDSENVYVTLSARVLRPTLFILARANHPDAEAKLQRAGATRVISPYSVGGRLMAMLAVRPLSVEFVDTVLHNLGGDVLLEDVNLSAGSPLVGLTVEQARQTLIPDVGVLAVKSGERVILTPSNEICLSAGDTIAVIGTAAQLAVVEAAASA